MRPSQKLALRRSELHQTINELNGVETLTDEQRSALDAASNELRDVEVKWRAAVQTEEAEDATQRPDTPENRELSRLHREARVGDVIAAALDGQATTGATRELQDHYGLAGNFAPVELFADEAPIEDRATAAPANVGQNQHAIIPAVYGETLAAWLGVDRPTVSVGEQVFPVLTTGATVHTPAEGGAAAASDLAFAADVLIPQRAQAATSFSVEDRARFAGMESAIRSNLRTAIGDGLDKYAFAGDKGFLGANSDLAAVVDASAEETFASYGATAYGAVDGLYAQRVGDIRMAVGKDTYVHASGKYRTNNSDENAIDMLGRITGGVRISTHVPAVAAKDQNAVISLRPGQRNAVMPIWRGVEIIGDRVTKANVGEIVVTAITLFAFKVLRSAAFKRVDFQVQA